MRCISLFLIALGYACMTLASEVGDFVKTVGMGVNIGHTFDIKRDWSNIDISEINSDFKLWTDSEVSIKDAVEGYKNLGFHAIRIPVKWSPRPTTETPIEPKLLKAVEEVVRSVIDNDMYAIINLETDNIYINGFISEDKDVLSETYDSFKGTWKQIATHFKDFDNHLLFEAFNESGYFETIWNTRTADGDRPEALEKVLQINQEFVNVVRSIEGYNEKRFLLIEGYACDPILTQDHFYKIPRDPTNYGNSKLIVSIYYFIPSGFTVIDKYGQWGASNDVRQLQQDIDDLRYRFVIQGVPVIITKYGCITKNRSKADIRSYLSSVANVTESGEIPSFLSDIGEFIDRTTVPLSFIDKELGKKYLDMGKRFNPQPTIKDDDKNDEKDDEKEVCFSEPDYPCCSKCDVEIAWNDESNGQRWGVENGNWCGILPSCFKTTTTTAAAAATTTTKTSTPTSAECWSLALGYPCCQSTTKVYTKDDSGSWGVENNQWCGILTN